MEKEKRIIYKVKEKKKEQKKQPSRGDIFRRNPEDIPIEEILVELDRPFNLPSPAAPRIPAPMEEVKGTGHERMEEVKMPMVNPLKVFLDQGTIDLLTSLYNNPRFTSRSKKRFYQAVKESYPKISYEDVSQFMEMKPEYKLFKIGLSRSHKLTKPKPKRKYKEVNELRQQKTAVRVMKPNYKWQIDITHPPLSVETVGSKNILTIIDVFSKYAFAFPIPDKSGRTMAFWLEMIFTRYKAPIILQSDGGKEFLGPFMKSLLKKYQVKHLTNPAYTPLGIVERFNQTFKNMLAQANNVTGGSLSLDMLIDQVLDNYNSLPHSSHKHSPKEVHFSKDPLIRWSARKINIGMYNKSNDRVVPYEKDQLVAVNIRDWPNLDRELKKELFTEAKTKGMKAILNDHHVENEEELYQIDSRSSIPGTNPVVYIYRIRSIGPVEVFTKNYLHQQLHLIG